MQHPCLSCGACCATFRVSFYWSEADPFLGGSVPDDYTEKLNTSCLAMRGTNQPTPRCVALEGEIGHIARCGIYLQRPSVCRDLQPSWANGTPSPQCDRARLKHKLLPLEPGWSVDPSGPDNAPAPQAA